MKNTNANQPALAPPDRSGLRNISVMTQIKTQIQATQAKNSNIVQKIFSSEYDIFTLRHVRAHTLAHGDDARFACRPTISRRRTTGITQHG